MVSSNNQYLLHSNQKQMKKIITLSIICMIIYHFGNCQNDEKTTIYEIRSNIPVWACDVQGKKIKDTFSIPPYKSRFAFIKKRGDSVVVRFLKWSQSSPISLKNEFNDSTYEEGSNQKKIFQRYFLIQKADFDSFCVKVYATNWRSAVFTLGLVTMPLKLRVGNNFDFQGNLSLGTTAGAKMRISPYNSNYINLLFGASISTISLDSFSTGGKITGQPLTNIAVFSPSLGIVFDFGKAQAGVFYGWDILNNSAQSKYNWIYNGKPWLSIGFGVSIFSVDSKSSSSRNGENTARINSKD